MSCISIAMAQVTLFPEQHTICFTGTIPFEQEESDNYLELQNLADLALDAKYLHQLGDLNFHKLSFYGL